MYILNQDKRKVINTDNVINIYVVKFPNEKPDIRCLNVSGYETILGSYNDEERCMEILKEIPMFSDKKLYEMPKE